MKHASIKLTPIEAVKGGHDLKAKVNMSIHAIRSRKYPEIKVGDKVRIYRKTAITEKERTSQWNKEIHEVEKIEKKCGQRYFYIKNDSRGYLRNEILKV